ncbi:MAG TPA: cytochrome P450 [Vicinamibacteria bacterium]|nr:cytochrome P450 [Vicinamibacteria bacterium]
MPAVRVARSEELRGDGPHAASAAGLDVVLVRTGDGLRAFQGHCPHQGALLGEGELDGDSLVCRNHRWRFALKDGRREGGPQCLATYAAFDKDGEVFVEVGTPALQTPDRPASLRTLRDLPGPKGLPIVGNSLQLDLLRLHEILEGWAAEYGRMYRFRLGRRQFVALADPELSSQVLRARPETFRRTSNVQEVFAEMGVDGVFSAEGAAWRPQRRLSMEALSHRHLRGFYPTLRTVAGRLQKRWASAAGNGGRIDVLDDLKRFTVDVTTLLTFGHDVNTIEQGDDVIQRHLELVFPAFNRRIFAVWPTWRWIRLPADRRLDRALAELRTWLRGLVASARARLAADPSAAERPANFLEAMLAARDDAGQPFSDDVIFGNLMTMLLAGEDTTAYTLAWTVHHVCDSPAALAGLRRELDSVLGPNLVPDDFDAANRLAYAGAVANESMRLRPVAPFLVLEANADTVVGDVVVPAGTKVAALARPPVREAANFEAPEEFRPERWLGAPGGAHEPSAHMPFGSGPRLCPGRTLALLEMKVVLATLYRSFDVARVGPSAAVRENFAFTMSPVGLDVRLRPRA